MYAAFIWIKVFVHTAIYIYVHESYFNVFCVHLKKSLKLHCTYIRDMMREKLKCKENLYTHIYIYIYV